MDDLDSAQFDAEAAGFSLIDSSISDDDFLMSSSEANTVDSQSEVPCEEAHMGEPSHLKALQRPKKTGKCNLRKSLAWDSAFFTSDGVLDAEELTSIHEGDHLPSIDEDLSKSTDSLSTFQSEILTLESVEADLFSDIRASVQRSSTSSPAGSNNKVGDSGYGRSTKKVQPSSGSIVKSKSSIKKIDPAGQGPLRLLKPSSVSKMVIKPAVRSRESSSSLLRPPAATGKPSLEGAALNKRMSAGTSRAKSETNISGNIKGTARGALIPKVSRLVACGNTSQKALASSKLSSASSIVNRSAIHSSQSSCGSSCSSSSDTIRKSLPGVKRKVEKNASLTSGSTVRTPSRAPVNGNVQTGESKLSTFVKSASQLSPNISPASSISEWSAESTSSTATVNQKHSGIKHCSSVEDAIAHTNVPQNIPKHSKDRSLKGLDNQVASTQSHSGKQPLAGTSTSLVRPGSAKPSGLRLPSPKLGFFDGVKAGTKAPSGSARGRSALLSGGLAKPAGNHSPSAPGNKVKLNSVAAKVMTPAATRQGTAKPGPGNINVSPKSIAQLQGRSAGLLNSSNSKNDYGSSSASPKTKNAKSSLELNSVGGEAANVRKHVANVSEVKDHSAYLKDEPSAKLNSVPTKVKTPTDRKPGTSGPGLGNITASPKSTAQLQGDSAGLLNISSSVKDSGSFSGSPNTNYANSAIEINSIVAEAANGEKHVTDSGSEVKDLSTSLQNESSAKIVDDNTGRSFVLPESISPKSAVLGEIKVAQEAGEMEHVDDIGVVAKDLSGVMLQVSHVANVDDGPYPNSELLRDGSPKSASERDNNVAEVANEGRNLDSMFNADLGVSEREDSKEEKQLTADKPSDVADGGPLVMCATDCLKNFSSSPASTGDLCDITGTNALCDRRSSQYVNDDANLCARQENNVLGAVRENQISESAVVESEENNHARNQTEELNRHEETGNNETAVQSELQNSFQSETILKEFNNSVVLPCPEDLCESVQNDTAQIVSSSLPSLGVRIISEIRTPFAVKNSVSDVSDASNSLTVSPVRVEACVKMDAQPSSEKVQKENS